MLVIQHQSFREAFKGKNQTRNLFVEYDLVKSAMQKWMLIYFHKIYEGCVLIIFLKNIQNLFPDLYTQQVLFTSTQKLVSLISVGFTAKYLYTGLHPHWSWDFSIVKFSKIPLKKYRERRSVWLMFQIFLNITYVFTMNVLIFIISACLKDS